MVLDRTYLGVLARRHTLRVKGIIEVPCYVVHGMSGSVWGHQSHGSSMGYPRVHGVFNRDVRRRRVATAFNATVSSPLAYSFIPALYVPMDGTHEVPRHSWGVSPHTRA